MKLSADFIRFRFVFGKLYNTDTATCLTEWNSERLGSFEYCSNALYRSRKGTYFLTMSDCCGTSFKILTFKEAKKWGESYMTVEEYIAEFGVPEEG